MSKVRGRLVGVAIAVLLLLIALEIGLRVVVGLGNPLLYREDPAAGYVLLPNQHVRRFGFHTNINSQGLRSPDFSAQKHRGTVRILFLGDSITNGTTRVDQKDIFALRIGRQLRQDLSTNVETLNAAEGGWAIWNENGFIRSRGIFQSDYVVQVLNTGDLPQAPSRLTGVAEFATERPLCAICELITRVREMNRRDAGASDAVDPNQEQDNLRILSAEAAFIRSQGAKFAIAFVPFRHYVKDGQ